MLKDVLKFVLAAFVTGLFTALAATLYGLAVSQVATDESASQRAQMVHLLTDISKKLGGASSGIATRSVDLMTLEPVKITELKLEYEKPQFYKREFFIGAKLYRTSVALSGLSAANLQEDDLDKVNWKFNGNAIGTTFGTQPLFLSKIKKPLFSSKKSFDVTAQVWLNKELAESEDISNPLELKAQVEWD